jgi:hypothetical protein
MTRLAVLRYAFVAAVAYVAGLLAVLAWPSRSSANQDVVLTAGIAVLVVVGVALDWVVFGRRPSFGYNPSRYRLPAFLALFAAFTFAGWARTNLDPDWALSVYLVCALLLLVGAGASEYWAASAATRDSGDLRAR